MKVAVFSDIHGNYQALDAILNDIKNENIDKIIFLGDSVSLGPCPNECIDRLIKENVIFINGNHELYLLNRKYYDEDMTEIEIEHNLWVLTKLDDEQLEFIEKQPLSYSLVINNNKYFYGIGSSGCVKDNKTFYYIIDKGNIYKKEIEFDRDLFNEIIYSIDYPDKDNISTIFFNKK